MRETMSREEQFSKLYNEHYISLYKAVVSVMGRGFWVEDIVQDTFLEAWKKYEQLQNHPDIAGWLFRTARFKIQNFYRKMEHQELLFQEAELPEKGAAEWGYEIKELELTLSESFTKEELLLFRRYYLWGYTLCELSSIHHISENNARVRISRLNSKLRRELRNLCCFIITLLILFPKP